MAVATPSYSSCRTVKRRNLNLAMSIHFSLDSAYVVHPPHVPPLVVQLSHIHPAMLAGIRTCYGRPATEPRAMHGDATPLPCLRTSHHRPLRPQPVHVSDLAQAKARDQLVPIVRQLLWESQRLWTFLSLVSATLQRQF
jgi:hypothetical protein